MHHPLQTSPCWAAELPRRYGRKGMWVLTGRDEAYKRAFARLGELAARYFEDLLHDGMTVGISWVGAITK